MAKRRRIVQVAAITALLFLPATVHAGAGGSPPAPGAAAAGGGTAYCCTTWTDTVIGSHHNAVHVLTGAGCIAIDDTAIARNNCSLTTRQAVKCRGEVYDPAAGSVNRCFSP